MHRALVLLGIGLVAFTAACTHPVKRDVFSEDGLKVFLRSDRMLIRTVEKEYSHPITISSVRIAHILSRIDIRTQAADGKQRVPAIPTEILYPAAEGIAQALAEATPDEQVVVMSTKKTKRFYLFDRKYLTSFIVYARGEHLIVHLSRSEWEIPPRREQRLPEPRVGSHPMNFRVYPSEAMAMIDKQSLAVAWRDPIFRDPTRTDIRPSGEVVRRNILMESPREDWEESQPSVGIDPGGLSPEQLRALADLEEARRRGQLTEAEYRSRKNAIVQP